MIFNVFTSAVGNNIGLTGFSNIRSGHYSHRVRFTPSTRSSIFCTCNAFYGWKTYVKATCIIKTDLGGELEIKKIDTILRYYFNRCEFACLA